MNTMKIGNTSIWDVANRIPEIYGTIVLLALIAYFFLMYAIGLSHITEFRLGNFVFLTAGVYFALKQYRRTHRDQMDYFHAFKTGMWTSAIAALSFSVFIFFYMHIDKNFWEMLAQKQPLGFYLNPYIMSFIISLEGVFSGLFATYMLSNFLADRKRTKPMHDQSEIIQ